MTKLKYAFYGLLFVGASAFFGVAFAYIAGRQLPDRVQLNQSKSFQASQDMIWTALMDIENFPIWKPGVRSVEMLGTNENGYTQWREFIGSDQTIMYEIIDYLPKTLIEVSVVSVEHGAKGTWVFKLSNYQDRGVLMASRYAVISNPLDRFIHRWIDTKYNEVDYFLMSLNQYLNQLIDDQDEAMILAMPDGVENNESLPVE